MSIFAFIVMAIGTSAAMPKDHDAMKYGVSFTIPSVELSAYDAVIPVVSYQVAEAESVGTFGFHPPTEVIKINSEFNNSYSEASAKKATDHILPEIRRLSCASVVAASDRRV